MVHSLTEVPSMNKYLLCLFSIVLSFTSVLAQDSTRVSAVQPKYLHISTNPSYADAYINNTQPNHSKEPDYKLPNFIEVPAGESSILVTLFRPEYADTSINVQLSPKDTSFIIVALRPNYDELTTEQQYDEIAHRERRKIGHKLLFTSIVPFVLSGVSALVSNYYIDRANTKKDEIKNTLIKDDESYQSNLDKFNDYRDTAKSTRHLAQFGLVLGGLVFTTGVILSF